MDQHQLLNLALTSFITAVLISIPLAVVLTSRLWSSLPQNRPRNKESLSGAPRPKACTTTIFLGSGGHTAEMLQLVSGLDSAYYKPRHYVVGSDDNSSVEKVHRLEAAMADRRANIKETRVRRDENTIGTGLYADVTGPSRNDDTDGEYTIHRIPRSRHAGSFPCLSLLQTTDRMSALHSLLRTSPTWFHRISSIRALSTIQLPALLPSPAHAPATVRRWTQSPPIHWRSFSTTGATHIYAKRTPRPKQRVVKEQKLKAARNTTATPGQAAHKIRFGGKLPSASQVVKSKARQWQKSDSIIDTIASSAAPAPRSRVISTSISVTSLEKGSRNPQFEHSFAPGFASAYRSKAARGPPLKTGNTGRDKAAAAERTLIEAGAKKRSGPKVRGFVPVRFALKPIASDIRLNLVSTRKIPTSKYALFAQSGSGPGTKMSKSIATEEGPVFAQTQGTVQDMMQQVAASRFQSMGLHPDVEKGIMELLAKTTGISKHLPTTGQPLSDRDLIDIKPTEIQAMSIPALIDSSKKSPYTLCAAETGSGKTLAYLIPILHDLKMQEDKAAKSSQDEGGVGSVGNELDALDTVRQYNQPRAIVLLPSRELVTQVSEILKDLSHTVKLRTLSLSHVKSPKSVSQRLASGPIDIVVATPASLLDHLPKEHARSGGRQSLQQEEEEERRVRGHSTLLEKNRLSLASLRQLVIDEADSMFDSGFGSEVTKVVRQAKAVVSRMEGPVKITVVSATLPKKVSDTLDETLPGMLKITTPSLHKSLPGLHQTFLDLKPYFGNRPKAILDILAKQQLIQASAPDGKRRRENTLIFCNTKHSCDLLYEHLKSNKVHGVLGVLHGDAANRDEILRQFTDDNFIPPVPAGQKSPVMTAVAGGKILISTDIASRGIDTTAVQHVVLYDFPVTIVDYLHRVGRTARGGRGGRATSLVGRKDRNMAERIMVGIRLGKKTIPKIQNCTSLTPKQYNMLEKVMYGVKLYETSSQYAIADPTGYSCLVSIMWDVVYYKAQLWSHCLDPVAVCSWNEMMLYMGLIPRIASVYGAQNVPAPQLIDGPK
ncbi:RNA helicase [Linnemannia zychae]|nr:RNA helicase [Linnemannia zychae]